MKKEKDFRIGRKVIATIELEDKGQDFIELDVLENGIMLGHSVMFKNGRLTLLGVGTSDGIIYHTCDEILADRQVVNQSVITEEDSQFVYFYGTEEEKPLPWNASTLKYVVVGVKKAVKQDRFTKK